MRRLLIWLLMLALPAQALAAASVASCGPAPRLSAPTPATPAQPVLSQIHPCGDSLVPQKQAQPLAQHEPATPVGDDLATFVSDAGPADASHLTPAGTHKCSACASCCAGGAMISAMPQLPPPASCATEFVAVVQAIEAVAAGGPDRPPRGLLA